MVRFKNYESKRLSKIAKLCKQGSVLDIGYAQHPNPFLTNASCTGLDLNLPTDRSHYDEEIIGDATDLEPSLQGRVFDNIIAGELIEHLERPYDFLKSRRQFMSPNSQLILSTPNPLGWPCVFFEWIQSTKFYYTKEHLYYFPPRWVRRMLEHTGFQLDRAVGVGFLLPLYSPPAPTSLSYQVIYVASLNAKVTVSFA